MTLGYLTDTSEKPMVSFHLSNGNDPGAKQSRPPPHEGPLLLAVRFGSGPIRQTLRLHPGGPTTATRGVNLKISGCSVLALLPIRSLRWCGGG